MLLTISLLSQCHQNIYWEHPLVLSSVPGVFCFWFCFCLLPDMSKFLGQGMNLHCSCRLCYSCSNAGSLTSCATRELPVTDPLEHYCIISLCYWILFIVSYWILFIFSRWRNRNSKNSSHLVHFLLTLTTYCSCKDLFSALEYIENINSISIC